MCLYVQTIREPFRSRLAFGPTNDLDLLISGRKAVREGKRGVDQTTSWSDEWVLGNATRCREDMLNFQCQTQPSLSPACKQFTPVLWPIRCSSKRPLRLGFTENVHEITSICVRDISATQQNVFLSTIMTILFFRALRHKRCDSAGRGLKH